MTEEIEPQICPNCIKDNRLKLLVLREGELGVCSGCNEKNKVLNSLSDEFTQMMKALVRFHFSEWHYNTHIGGDEYYKLFNQSDNIFFHKERFSDQEIYDELVNNIECAEVYEEHDKGVSLFSGYYEGHRNSPLVSIKSYRDPDIIEISKRLKNENYFLFEKEMCSILESYKYNCTLLLEKDTSYYRGRIGYDDKKRSFFGGWEGEMVYVPFSNSKIGAPPPFITGVGRINRHGVSFFYCATDKYTAVAEIRPHPGDILSIGKFILKKQIKVFDLTDQQFTNYYESDKKLDEFKRLSTLCELMNKVIPPSERDLYSITQLIADCARLLEFEGILFNSSVGDGYNLVLFDPTNVEYTFDDAEAVEIEAVKYDYFPREWEKNIDDIE